MKYFPLLVHVVLFTMCLGLTLGAGAEHARPMVIGLLGGLTAGLGLTAFIRVIASIP